jgi:hypothetical protein
MIIFSQHALLKLEQRNIPKLFVTRTLKSPDHKSDSYKERGIAYKKFGELYLKVIYKRARINIIVITQYWEENPKLIKKYGNNL